ncbi:MAG: peroxiredoxin [Burkholderiaceae bacterium]|nr:peroxiredoxin [Burkholderiaceae bacterium]
MSKKDYASTPDNLPVPIDDGATDHVVGMTLPSVMLDSTQGGTVDLSTLSGYVVVYCYPMTGQPNVPLPEGWDQIPGARGCTPQSCAFRDHYQELQALHANVFGLSVQSTEYQREMATRLHLPFQVLSDEQYQFQKALNLPTFVAAGMTLLKRVTFISHQGRIEAVHYPIFPSDSDPAWVLNYLRINKP